MAFKLFKSDDEHFDDAVDLIKRKEYEKAMAALRKSKGKDKDGNITAKCDAMEAFINLYNKQDDPGAYINAANKLKAYTDGPLEMGLSTFDPAKLADECLLMSKTINARKMPSSNSDENMKKANALQDCAKDFQTKIGNDNLTIREFFGGGVTVGMKEIFSSDRIRILMPRDWLAAMLRRVLHGEITCRVPCSLFRNHKDCMIYASNDAIYGDVIPKIRVYNKK